MTNHSVCRFALWLPPKLVLGMNSGALTKFHGPIKSRPFKRILARDIPDYHVTDPFLEYQCLSVVSRMVLLERGRFLWVETLPIQA